MARVPKERLDVLVTQRGEAESRERAKRLIMAGAVRVAGHVQTKAGIKVPCDSEITVKQSERFVSRGGHKMEAAFENFSIDVTGLACADVGASTGGFTDCLLQHGASRVASLDVGKGQLHWRLRNDPRVTVMEGINVRHMEDADFPFVPQFAGFDVSFISLRLVMPPVVAVLAAGGQMVTLIKPQFEAGREQVCRGGVVRDSQVHRQVVDAICQFGEAHLPLRCLGTCPSPVIGPAGNIEFLAYWEKTA